MPSDGEEVLRSLPMLQKIHAKSRAATESPAINHLDCSRVHKHREADGKMQTIWSESAASLTCAGSRHVHMSVCVMGAFL